jgi:hypothetical protein
MIIRQAQLDVFQAHATAEFEEEMRLHLQQFSPRHCEVIQDTGVREVVKVGMRRAAQCAFTRRGPIRLYLELMFMFGTEFGTDPQHAWSAKALDPLLSEDEMFRAELLFEAAQEYLARVSGPNHRYAAESLRRTRQAIDRAPASLEMGPDDLAPALKSALRYVYPEKADYLREQGLSTIISLGFETAATHRVQSARGMALFVFLVFALGHGIADDPLYPWVRSALHNILVRDPHDRAARLEARATVYLDRVIEYVKDM